MAKDDSLGKYFKAFQKGIRDLRKLVIGGIEDELAEEAELAAEEIRLALEEIIGEISSNRQAGALVGYVAVKEKTGERNRIVLPKSKVSLATGAEWLVTVEPSAQHRSIGLNVFNILDEGRPELPKRDRPYILPNAGPIILGGDNISIGRESNARIPDSGDKFSGSNPYFSRSVRNEPRQKGQKIPGAAFSHGPIRAVGAKRLYERAESRAQKRLILKNLRAWDVVLTGNFDA